MAVANVDVRVDSTGAVRSLNQINAASKTTTAGVNSLKSAVAGLGIAFSAIQAAKFVFAKTAELETQTRSIQTLTGSVVKAKQIIQELQQIGAVTPFTSTELIDTAKRLSAFGVAANQVVDTTRRLGDVAGATGANLGELSLAYGQVIAKGRLQGEELLQFQERGVALQDELRKMYGLTGEEFSKALSKGQISAQAVEVALQRLTNTGGKYANGAIAQSDTLAGRFSTLQDGVDEIARKIGNALTPALKRALQDAINFANGFAQALAFASQQYSAFLQGLRGKGQAGIQQDIATIDRLIKIQQGYLKNASPVIERSIQNEIVRLRAVRASFQKDLDKATGLVAPVGQSTLLPQVASTPPPLGAGSAAAGGDKTTKRATDKAAADRRRAAEAIAESSRALGIAQQQFVIEQRLISARRDENELLIITRKAQLDLLAIRAKGNEILANKDLPAQAKANALEQVRYDAKRIALELSYAISEEERKQLENGGARIEQIIKLAEGYSRNLSLTQELTAEQQKQKDLADGIANTIGQGMASAFDGLIQGTENFGASLRKIASGVLVDIANQLLRVLVINQAINAISNLFGPKTGGNFLPGTKFQPAAFSMPSLLPGRATGGSVTAGQPYLVGERGPELFMPGRSGGIAPTGSFGGGPTVVVNVDASGTSVQGNQPEGQALGRAVAAAVQAELVKQKRPGGILA